MLKSARFDIPYLLSIGFLLVLSVFVLKSVASTLFPSYFLFLVLGIILFFVFSQIDFEVLSLFAKQFYLGSIVLLVITLLIGRVTRGVVRWIPLGTLTLQAAEIVKPFLLVFFANYLFKEKLTFNRFLKILFLMFLPIILILVQPSLGVSFLLAAGFFGIFLASNIKKRYFVYLFLILALLLPLFWFFLAPYQKARLISFTNPYSDPLGKGYNSIQSIITIGSGGILGRGLGRGVQTQLAFLPEKHSDFIFAAISEELGFVGSIFTIVFLFLILWRLVVFMNNSFGPEARAFLSGLFLTLLAQIVIHVGMNLGLLPITGIPLPLVSAGGSSLIATMIGLGIALGARRR